MSTNNTDTLQLVDIKGIGPKTAEKLEDKGIKTPEDLACRRPDEVADIIGITKKAAREVVNDAKDKCLGTAVPVVSFTEQDYHIRNVVQRIPTGSSKLDALLGGGIRTEATTLLKGEYSTGKTQVCNQAAINCIKYLKRKVAWIEMESATFATDRLSQMAKAAGIKINGAPPDQGGDFLIIPSKGNNTPFTQFLAYERVDKMIREKGLDVGLLIIDSFNGSFREYFSGLAMLPARARETARHLGFLDKMSAKHNMAILMTAQVMDIPDAGGQLGEIVKSGHRKKAYGGNVLNHWSTYILSLHQMSTKEWEACLADAPNMPKGKIRFQIVASGIRDI